MYENLVNALRTGYCEHKLLSEAADAIELLCHGIDGLDKLVVALRGALPKWIPVTEKKPLLPETEDVCFVNVIAAIRGRKESAQVKYCRAYRYRDGKRERIERFVDDDGNVDVTHWMPMPEPPNL